MPRSVAPAPKAGNVFLARAGPVHLCRPLVGFNLRENQFDFKGKNGSFVTAGPQGAIGEAAANLKRSGFPDSFRCRSDAGRLRGLPWPDESKTRPVRSWWASEVSDYPCQGNVLMRCLSGELFWQWMPPDESGTVSGKPQAVRPDRLFPGQRHASGGDPFRKPCRVAVAGRPWRFAKERRPAGAGGHQAEQICCQTQRSQVFASISAS